MKNRVITGAIVAVVMLLVIVPAFTWPLWTLVLLTLIALFCTWELHQALQRIFKPLSLPLMLVSSLMLLAPALTWAIEGGKYKGWQFIAKALLPPSQTRDWSHDFRFLLGLGMTDFAVAVFFLMTGTLTYTVLKYGPARIPQTVAAFSSAIYIGAPFACLTIYLFAVPNGYRWLFLAVFLPWLGDVAAYYCGRFWGKRPFFPAISPNKTLEGALGGIVAGALICCVYFILFLAGPDRPFHVTGTAAWFGFLTGALVTAAGAMGDLFGSGLKRWVSIKDFSHILPGHGGVMDRFDSVLFGIPVCMLMTVLYYLV